MFLDTRKRCWICFSCLKIFLPFVKLHLLKRKIRVYCTQYIHSGHLMWICGGGLFFSPSLQASIFCALRSFAQDLRAHANKLVKLCRCLSYLAAFKWSWWIHQVVTIWSPNSIKCQVSNIVTNLKTLLSHLLTDKINGWTNCWDMLNA